MIILTSSGWKSGLREWTLQRFTGVFVAFYFLFVVAYFFILGDISYSIFACLFSSFYFKLVTLVFMFSLVLHLNIGMGVILSDYVKVTLLRATCDFIVNLILLAYIFSIMQILWGFK